MRPQPPLGRSAGLVVPLFSLHSSTQCRYRRHRRPCAARGVDAARGSACVAAAARRHASGRGDLAVLGVERDGDRPGVHQPGRGAGLCGARRGGAAATGGSDRAQERARCVGSAVYDRAPGQAERARVWRSACSGTSTGSARRRAPARLPRTPRGRSGGWATTPSTARCANGMATVPGPSGRRRCATGNPRRSSRRVANWSRRSSFISTSSGSPTRSGRRPASNWARSGSLATFRSWSAPTAPTSGPTSTPSASIAPSARRPDAFSATGQDWGLPVYRWDVMAAEDDRWLRQRARRMARLYDGYRVDHLVGFFRTYSRRLGEVARRVRSR